MVQLHACPMVGGSTLLPAGAVLLTSSWAFACPGMGGKELPAVQEKEKKVEDTTQPQNQPVRIPVVVDADFDPNELVQLATQSLLESRKEELSGKIKKLFYKADGLLEKKNKAEAEAKKAGDQLQKTLDTIEKLKSGDWTVLSNVESDN